MPLTRVEADQIAEEARQQGWEGDKHIVDEGTDHEYNEGYGRVMVHDWDEINRYRIAHNNDPWSDRQGNLFTGCTVELHWPDLQGPEYHISERDEWRKLKAKVDELSEIIKQMNERGWPMAPWSHLRKAGKLGMMIEVVPPGGKTYAPVRIGGMRAWKKLCREYDSIIELYPDALQIEPAKWSPQTRRELERRRDEARD